MSVDDATQEVTSATSEVWSKHVPVPGTPEGFTARTPYPTNPDGVEVMLERWQAGPRLRAGRGCARGSGCLSTAR